MDYTSICIKFNSTNSQTDAQQIFDQVYHIEDHIKSGLKETFRVLIQNKDLKKEVKNIYEHLNKELGPRNRTYEISNTTRNNKQKLRTFRN